MKRIASMIAMIVVLTWGGQTVAQDAPGCSFFLTWDDAQRHFEEDPETRWRFDPDGDGIVCETLRLSEGRDLDSPDSPFPAIRDSAQLKTTVADDPTPFWKSSNFWGIAFVVAFGIFTLLVAIDFGGTPSHSTPHAPERAFPVESYPSSWGPSPEALRAMPYSDYLQTPYWKAVRERTFALQGRRCTEPGCSHTQNLHVHHLTYDRRGAELNDDLQVLCTTCHRRKHGLF